jgi:hypothetical protein
MLRKVLEKLDRGREPWGNILPGLLQGAGAARENETAVTGFFIAAAK